MFFLNAEGNTLSNIKIINRKEFVRVKVFHILQQLADNPYWEAERIKKGPSAYTVAASDKEFYSAERTLAKTLQEIFTPPTARLVFKRDDKDSPDNTKDFSNIVIDPERITPTLLENLGLDEFIPPKGERMPRAKRMEYMARAIPHILEMMKHLEPLQLPHQWHEGPGKYFRLMRINSGKNRGYVLGTQTNGKKKIMFKTDIHGAYRRLAHIMEESYEDEIALLVEIQMTARDIHANLGDKQAMTNEDMAEMFREMQKCVDDLLYVKNKHKVKMRDKIRRAITLGRNSGAQRAILVMIPKYAEERKGEVRAIEEKLHRDDSICKDYILEQQKPAEKLYHDFEKKKNFDARKPISPQTRQEFDGYLKRRRAKIDPEDSSMRAAPLMQPYLAFGEKMIEHIDQTREINRGPLDSLEDRTHLFEEFLKLYVVSKIQHFYIRLQAFYQEYLSSREMPNFDDVLKSLKSLDVLIVRKTVTAKNGDEKSDVITTPEYDDVYKKVRKLVNKLVDEAKGAKLLLDEEDDYSREVECIKEAMKKLFKSFRFDLLIYSMGEDCGVDFDSMVVDRPLPLQMDLPLREQERRDQE